MTFMFRLIIESKILESVLFWSDKQTDELIQKIWNDSEQHKRLSIIQSNFESS